MRSEAVGAAFEAQRTLLWGLAYRLTGSSADADDVLQETFVRALRAPPLGSPETWRPWLVRVATRVGLDLLRRRRRRRYDGPWLPSPVETASLGADPAAAALDAGGRPGDADDQPRAPSSETRYELAESVSFAFLLALEALTPQQRAVLLLCDVFDYRPAEAAELLDITPGNARTVLCRARRAMREYDRCRVRPSGPLGDRTRRALERFLAGLAARDAAAIERLLAADVVSLQDGGGEVAAARRSVGGRTRVRRLFAGLFEKAPPLEALEIRTVNGLPAALLRLAPAGPRVASRLLVACDLDDEDRIRRLYVVLAPGKLGALGASA